MQQQSPFRPKTTQSARNDQRAPVSPFNFSRSRAAQMSSQMSSQMEGRGGGRSNKEEEEPQQGKNNASTDESFEALHNFLALPSPVASSPAAGGGGKKAVSFGKDEVLNGEGGDGARTERQLFKPSSGEKSPTRSALKGSSHAAAARAPSSSPSSGGDSNMLKLQQELLRELEACRRERERLTQLTEILAPQPPSGSVVSQFLNFLVMAFSLALILFMLVALTVRGDTPFVALQRLMFGDNYGARYM